MGGKLKFGKGIKNIIPSREITIKNLKYADPHYRGPMKAKPRDLGIQGKSADELKKLYRK